MAQTRTFELPIGTMKVVGTAITDNPARGAGGAPVLRKVLYSSTQKEHGLLQFVAKRFGSDLSVELKCAMNGAVAGKHVVMGVEVKAFPARTGDVDDTVFDTVNKILGGSVVPGDKEPFSIKIACPNADSLAINDIVALRIPRDVASQFDDATAELELLGVVVSYTTSSSSSSTSSSSTSSSSST